MTDDEGSRAGARRFLQARDLEGLDDLSKAVAFTGLPVEEYEAMLREELALLDHDTQVWWGEPCNCHGELN